MSSHRASITPIIAAVAIAVSAGIAQAADYPVKPVRLVVSQPPGGNMDMVARAYGQRLGEHMGVQFVIDNRGGGGGVIASEMVVHAQPDGYNLLVAGTGISTNPGLIGKLSFDAQRDLTPVSLLAAGPNLLVVGANNPMRSVRDVIAAARERPGRLNFASSGFATSTQMAGELFRYMTKVDIQPVVYKGASVSLVAVSSGESDMSFAGLSGSQPLVRAGKLRAIAVTGARRWAPLPDMPTVAEAGVPGYECTGWHALLAPARFPAALQDRYAREIAQIAQVPELRSRMINDGLEPTPSTPKELADYLASETTKWTALAKAAGLGARQK